MGSCIIVGKSSFSIEYLTTRTLKECLDQSKKIPKGVVEKAWKEANPRKSKNKK